MNSYDRIPYQSYPYPQSAPERLAVIGHLLGMSVASLDKARVLELGSSSGGNIIPVAERHPGSRAVGVDASAVQIEIGKRYVADARIGNANLLQVGIEDVDASYGEFDYIICHGVYSWVPPAVQEKILAVCKNNLAPSGVAYVSYNTFPGWRMRGVIRDMMLYHSRDSTDPAERVRHARAMIDMLAQAIPKEKTTYGAMLHEELEGLRDKEESYLFHEHLEENNEPVYFHEFVSRVQKAGLQYLAEAEGRLFPTRGLPASVAKAIEAIADGPIEVEQYMDLIQNRTFRQTLLCHDHVKLDRQVTAERIRGLYCGGAVRSETPVVDVQSKAPATFVGGRATTKTTEPVVKAALLHLGAMWPAYESVSELVAIARSRTSTDAVVVDADQASRDTMNLIEPLFRCYLSGQIELSVDKPKYTGRVAERPMASRYARYQAETSNRVTNRRHESVRLTDLERHVLLCLDGEHDADKLLDAIVNHFEAGRLSVRHAGEKIEERSRLREVLVGPLQEALEHLCRLALLVE